MAMIDWVDRLLHNWARWLEGGQSDGLGYGSASIWNKVRVDGEQRREAVIPTNACEASETHEDVKRLPLVLRDTVELYYTRTQNRAGLASLMGCALPTVDARLTKAHRLIAEMHSEREQKREAVRLNYESKTKAALDVQRSATDATRAVLRRVVGGSR